MKKLKIIAVLTLGIFLGANIAFAENSSGEWTNVTGFYTYMGNGAFCGGSWAGGTLIKLTPGSSIYPSPCESDLAFLDTEAAGGDAALATLLSAHATGKEVKINVDTDNPLVCETSGKYFCRAVQVNMR